ncbi:hypothetical protein LA6_000517 [Marinibacterium anthonyi]|nr:hypothetical protein LA6_000517 [Marinibacterium anthonyi]
MTIPPRHGRTANARRAQQRSVRPMAERVRLPRVIPFGGRDIACPFAAISQELVTPGHPRT